MTKVTVEMLAEIESRVYMEGEDGTVIVGLIAGAFPVDTLRALIALCRRVIEPGEGDLERCADAAGDISNIKSGHYLEDVARAVLAAIADP